jgi:hypothetical protein
MHAKTVICVSCEDRRGLAPALLSFNTISTVACVLQAEQKNKNYRKIIMTVVRIFQAEQQNKNYPKK